MMKISFESSLKLCLLVIYVHELCALDFNYHKYNALENFLLNFTVKYPQLSPKVTSIGKSVKGRNLTVVEVTAANGSKIGIPNVKLIGNIHGNEAVGREILLHFLEFLGESYGKDRTISWLLENTRIHVLPSMNPDGFEIAYEGICSGEHGRGNAKNMDLNRNFPDFYSKNLHPTQPEAAAVQKWMKNVPFILSASLHGGALVANYPFDTIKEMKWEKLLRELMETNNPEEQQNLRDAYIVSLPENPPSISADDDVFIYLAKVYANKHPTMHLGLTCPESNENFTGGITNGAAWYPFRGGMQDFNYVIHGCMELTLEISCCKYPPSRELPTLWEYNKYALLDLIKQAHMGVRGTIYNSKTHKPIRSANLEIVGRDMNFTTSKYGEFWRILLPGTYQLQVKAIGYHPEVIPFKVLKYGASLPNLTTLHIHLINESFPRPTTSTSTQRTSSITFPTSTERFTSIDKNNTFQTKNFSEYGRDHSKDQFPVQLEITGLNNMNYHGRSGDVKLNLTCGVLYWLLLMSVLRIV